MSGSPFFIPLTLMKRIVLLFIILLQGSVFGQIDLAPDTVLFTERTGGAIDTFDLANADLPSTFDGGRALSGIKAHSVDQLFLDITGYRLNQLSKLAPLRYSSLPHLGFSYSFGSQGTQFLHLDYTQAFKPNLLFNLNYDRKTGAGFLRNSSFSSDYVSLRLQRSAQRYSFSIKGRYLSTLTEHPEGIIAGQDSVIEDFGLEFVSVYRAANSEMKQASVELQQFLNITNDSLNHLGLVSKHLYEIKSRRFYEVNSTGLEGYSLYNYHTDSTYDNWSNPSIRNGAGVYFLNKTTNFYLDASVHHTYWNSWDIQTLRDTNEIGLSSELGFEWKGIDIGNSMNLNLIGGFNGWSNSSRAKFESERLTITGGFQISSLPADALQRFYYSNNYDYVLNVVDRQVWTKLNGSVSYTVKDSLLTVGGKVSQFSAPSVYTFNGDDWGLTDSLGSASSVGFNAHLQIGDLNWMPEVVLSSDKYGYLPSLQVYSRMYLKGRLFAAKKLEATIGVDFSYQNGYQLRTYAPSVDAFYWAGSSTVSNPGMTNLHFFAAMGIEQFRFFVRFENIGYFWNDRKIQEAYLYPISVTRLRLGITWDFFN